MTRLTDERIASLARQYLGTCKRVFYTKWKDGIDIEYPTLEVEQFARAIEAELSKQEPVEPDTVQVPRQLSEWHEDDGAVTWWSFPLNEPAWIGQPTDSDWPGYHTHWTPHPAAPKSTP